MRFGLLSTANINDAVLGGAAESSEVDIVAVASRDESRARAYALDKGLEHAFGSYEEMLASDAIDAVYIGLPNGLHVEWAIKALEAGKHVVVEKPFSPRVSEVERAYDVADDRGLVLTEAFMWRFSPQTRQMLAAAGTIGEVRLVRASFSFPLSDDDNVRWDPALEGGALMDVGCYCISAARLLLGEPTDIAGFGIDRGGVDSRFAGVLRFGSGALATFDCGFDLPERDEIEIVGSEGRLVLDDPWHAKRPGIHWHHADGRAEFIAVPKGNSYRLELEEVEAAVREGRPAALGREDAVGQARVIEALLA